MERKLVLHRIDSVTGINFHNKTPPIVDEGL
jgi:hypothetical protein